MLQKSFRFFYLQTAYSDNIMKLLQIDGNKLVRHNKHICLAMNCYQAYNMTIDVSLHGRLISLCLQRIAESGENI